MMGPEKDKWEHYTKEYESRYYQTVVEIWCEQLDESKGVIGTRYVYNCPMCGEALVEEE